jgi:hypothetical protein
MDIEASRMPPAEGTRCQPWPGENEEAKQICSDYEHCPPKFWAILHDFRASRGLDS